jgi:selenocysteine lyase/cysteine desulfurase
MPCILGLKAGVRYVSNNFNKINLKIRKLTKILYNYLKNNDKIKLYSFNPDSGVMSFNIIGYSSSEVGDYFSKYYDICVRTGLHCAPLIHQQNGTLKTGMVRVSISSFNKKSDIKTLIKAIKEFIRDND